MNYKEADPAQLFRDLHERVKELTALHQTANILQDNVTPAQQLMQQIVELIPPAWQYPGITGACIRFDDLSACTANFQETPWMQTRCFKTLAGLAGIIQVAYLKEMPVLDEGPFLLEERNLINSLSEMILSYFERKEAMAALQSANLNLEQQVETRTQQLQTANQALREEIQERKRVETEVVKYQKQLGKLTMELSLTEARERRNIASDLHDHIGQTLALAKMRLSTFQANAVFCGFEGDIEQIHSLMDRAIRYTRDLTLTISPPSLYELGLIPALENLADGFRQKHKLVVDVKCKGKRQPLTEAIQVLMYKSVNELLFNVLKHANADRITIRVDWQEDSFSIEVKDDGCGFDVSHLDCCGEGNQGFGLFSIRERLKQLGGQVRIVSEPGKGTSVMMNVHIREER